MQLKQVREPYGEVNVYPSVEGSPGGVRVRATILMEPVREGTQTGLALDGSGSMSPLYQLSRARRAAGGVNQLTPIARQLCAYLARKLDADGGTTCIYWATGHHGKSVEVVGDLTAAQAESHAFVEPQVFGSGTHLLPAVEYFVERFKDAPWGFYVFLTDGSLDDLAAVEAFSRRLAADIHAGRRKPLKLVLIGVGEHIDVRQMERLDDLDTGTDIDLWDHKIAADLRDLRDIFAEVVDRNARVAESGRVLDDRGRVLKDYAAGLPAVLEFEVPAGVRHFRLEVGGGSWPQSLADADFDTLPPATVPATTAPATAPAMVPATAPAALTESPPVVTLLPEILRRGNDGYIDLTEEREILACGVGLGLSVEESLAQLASVCFSHDLDRESVILALLAQSLASASERRSDGLLREEDFQQALCEARTLSRGRLEEGCLVRKLIGLIEEGGLGVRSGLLGFGGWYAKVKRSAGLS